MPKFDYLGAKKAGYSDEEIGKYLDEQNSKGVDLYIDKNDILSNSSQNNGQEEKGFFRKVAEGIVRPIAEVGVSGYNLAAQTYQTGKGLIKGDKMAKNEMVARDLPFLGKTEPAFTGYENTGQAAKKMVGYGSELGSYAVGGGGALNVGKTGLKGAILQGVAQGAKYGAISGALGAGGNQLRQNDATVGNTLKSIAGGAAGGAVVGGAFGGVTAAGSKAISAVTDRASNKALKASKEAYDIVAPELSKSEKIAATAGDRATKEGILQKVVIKPSEYDIRVAKASEGIVSKKNDAFQNIHALKQAIKNEAETVKASLKNNDVIFNTNQLSSHLDKVEKQPLVASDTRLNNAYELAKNKFIEFAGKEKKNLSGLLEARKKFDGWIEKSFPKIFEDESLAPLHTALKDMRTSANEFIASKLPKGNNFKSSLEKQSLMYQAIDNIAGKNYKQVGTTAWQRFGQNNPSLKKYGAAVATGLIGGGVAGRYLGD